MPYDTRSLTTAARLFLYEFEKFHIVSIFWREWGTSGMEPALRTHEDCPNHAGMQPGMLVLCRLL
jgi:hypothetical protein